MHDQKPPGPLAGFTVGVTAARRADELGALLCRRARRNLERFEIRSIS